MKVKRLRIKIKKGKWALVVLLVFCADIIRQTTVWNINQNCCNKIFVIFFFQCSMVFTEMSRFNLFYKKEPKIKTQQMKHFQLGLRCCRVHLLQLLRLFHIYSCFELLLTLSFKVSRTIKGICFSAVRCCVTADKADSTLSLCS